MCSVIQIAHLRAGIILRQGMTDSKAKEMHDADVSVGADHPMRVSGVLKQVSKCEESRPAAGIL